MFDKFPPPIRATIEAFFKNPLLGVAVDNHIGDLFLALNYISAPVKSFAIKGPFLMCAARTA